MLVSAQLNGEKRVCAVGESIWAGLDVASLEQPLASGSALLMLMSLWLLMDGRFHGRKLLDKLAPIEPGDIGRGA